MVALLYRVTPDGTRSVALDVDEVLKLTATSSSQVTSYPIEDGSVVTDHQTYAPDTYEVEFAISDRPNSGGYQPGRARSAWETMAALKKSREMLLLDTPKLGEIPRVRLMENNVDIQASTYETMRVTARFTQIQIATSQRVPAPKRPVKKTQPKVELGQQSGFLQEGDAGITRKSQTLLVKWFPSLGPGGG